jgi:mevalonate kinase
MVEEIELFVPGRLCLFGEHSDWAAGHRRQNSEIGRGYAIITPTDQGNYATVKKIPEKKLIFKTPTGEVYEFPFKEKLLLKQAQSGKFLSYISGVLHEVLVNYNLNKNGFEINGKNHGLEINNYKSNIPMKKGLSSSASICVLIAKALREVYDLPLSTKGIMNLAYLGEITTPSRCGKLDQACAYDSPILMIFDGDRIDVKEISIKKPVHLVIIDLNSSKDTKKILSDLNKGFPFPTTKEENKKHEYFNNVNKYVVIKASKALNEGDSKELGKLMKEAQKKFDEFLAPFCPEELKAPKLHKVLQFKKIKNLIYGGKGVGSQGDGSAQFLAKDKESQEKIVKILNSDKELDVHAIPLTICKK